MQFRKPIFLVSADIELSRELIQFREEFGNIKLEDADVIVVLGGDGFMLEILHKTQNYKLPVYGMNQGTIGFLMNQFSKEDLLDKLNKAEKTIVNPLKMSAYKHDGTKEVVLAINEVSLLRCGSQAAKVKIFVDGLERLDELVCDGALVSTPAGSTAYNYSSHGPIFPIDANILALTAMAAYRPRRWRGALLPTEAVIELRVLEKLKRPVSAFADGQEVRNVEKVVICSERKVKHQLLFDPGHGLQERLLSEQFL